MEDSYFGYNTTSGDMMPKKQTIASKSSHGHSKQQSKPVEIKTPKVDKNIKEQ
jgi:hypothetical protein